MIVIYDNIHARVAEWSKAIGLSPITNRFVGSNPTPRILFSKIKGSLAQLGSATGF
tara:strand:- start:1143 stop:1310 length:168 start_codon:yes stop_codon:yes gene_type:complete